MRRESEGRAHTLTKGAWLTCLFLEVAAPIVGEGGHRITVAAAAPNPFGPGSRRELQQREANPPVIRVSQDHSAAELLNRVRGREEGAARISTPPRLVPDARSQGHPPSSLHSSSASTVSDTSSDSKTSFNSDPFNGDFFDNPEDRSDDEGTFEALKAKVSSATGKVVEWGKAVGENVHVPPKL